MTPQWMRLQTPVYYFLLSLPYLFLFAESTASAAEVSRTITVTTPSRIEEPIEESTGSATVLTQPEIEVQNPTAASEVLRDLPGVNVLETGTIGEEAVLTFVARCLHKR